ncbi:glycosyltransferase family 2 protein [Candidatus Pseudothioglobus singularis]|jgi:dolichol-phosphate mannosyltransferase|nr:glycosyltransferase family 2 protein [Candidatus Pseudothioglobus singularis]
MDDKILKIAVVIPCFKVSQSLKTVLNDIGSEVTSIYCVDDKCPEESWKVAELMANKDSRIHIIKRDLNGGVGAAVISGYKVALEEGAEIIVKIDGDGQMDSRLIPNFIRPIYENRADFIKGNRFYDLRSISSMPLVRIIGNSILSFINKLSSGYWNIFDPNNGFTAVHAKVLKLVPMEKLNRRFFFEADMLFRLSTIRAVVKDIPMDPIYGNEKSNLSILNTLLTFPYLHCNRIAKRIFYNYFLRNFNIASLYLVLGLFLSLFGIWFGIDSWIELSGKDETASAGTVMLAAMPIIVGNTYLVGFLAYDIQDTPTDPIHPVL